MVHASFAQEQSTHKTRPTYFQLFDFFDSSPRLKNQQEKTQRTLTLWTVNIVILNSEHSG